MIPTNEKIIETKKCLLSGQEFVITDKDLAFYDAISPVLNGKKYAIPSPQLCPDERSRNRMMFRNFTHYYHRNSDLSGSAIISMYRPGDHVKVYSIKEWWSDAWNGFDYGRNFDFTKSFTENIAPLHHEVPRMALMNRESENCDYANLCWMSHDCYLVSGCVKNENCLYGHIVWKSKNCVDGLYIYESENCYDCIDCVGSFGLVHCQDCKDSRDCFYCIDCAGCTNCIGCVGLRNASYHILGKSVSKEEYAKKLADIQGRNLAQIPQFARQLEVQRRERPTPYMQGANNENVTGNTIYFSKNCYGYDIKRSENCKYCATIDGFISSQDINFSGVGSDFCYQGIFISGTNILFCHNCATSSNIFFCDNCYSTQNAFGCVGLKNQKNCILNTSYSQHEYEELAGKIIDHMRTTNEWGAFLSPTLSPFAYNETIANEYYPLVESEAKKRGYTWLPEEHVNTFIGQHYKPLPITQYDEKVVGYEVAKKNIDELLAGILECEVTKKPFKIIKQELVFYIENSIPIPTKHPDQRHKERMELRNPRKLFERKCDECGIEITTTYAPERSEKVVCEECYHKLVY